MKSKIVLDTYPPKMNYYCLAVSNVAKMIKNIQVNV